MGHAEKIHKHIYRQPVLSRDILRMSRLLEAAQGADSGSESEDEETQESSKKGCKYTKVGPIRQHKIDIEKTLLDTVYFSASIADSESEVEYSTGKFTKHFRTTKTPKGKKRSSEYICLVIPQTR